MPGQKRARAGDGDGRRPRPSTGQQPQHRPAAQRRGGAQKWHGSTAKQIDRSVTVAWKDLVAKLEKEQKALVRAAVRRHKLPPFDAEAEVKRLVRGAEKARKRELRDESPHD